MFILQLVGVLLIFLGAVVLALRPGAMRQQEKFSQNLTRKPGNQFLIGFGKRKAIFSIIGGIALFFIQGLFFYNPAGTITAVQYPWGGDKMEATQGVKVKGWGRTIQLSYEISIQDLILKGDQELPESYAGIYNRRADKWEFSDAIKADIGTAIVIEIVTEDEEKFLNMADRNRSETKLIYGRVLPNIDAALKNTCKLMDAQDYISGKASDFDRYFRDQLQNGMYLVEEYYEEDESSPEIIGDTATVRTVGKIGNSGTKQKKYKIKYDSKGEPLRDNESNSLAQYGIRFVQAQVTSIDWEASFDERLDKQKNEVALTQLEKQEAERQYYTAQKEIAKAESNKAKRRGELEIKQVEETIAADTKAKVAKYKEQEEANLLAAARKEAQRIRVTADAEAYEISKKVKAGITPEQELKMRLDAQVQMMGKLAGPNGITLPQTVFGTTGTSKNGDTGMLESIIGAEILKGNLGIKK